jgi:23S rRNA (cytosine1962-C5)-methyltransferase
MGRMTDGTPSSQPRSWPTGGPAADVAVPSVSVSSDLKASLAKGHPWIYRDHLPPGIDLAPGSWLRVHCDGWMGVGIFDPASPLSVRIYSRGQVPNAAWFEQSVERAQRRRAPLLADGLTTAYRLINGEGDGLPGIVVDVYGPFAVVHLDSSAFARLVPWVVSAVQRALDLKGICQKAAEGLQVLAGRAPPDRLIVSEHGLRFFADLGVAQKTGLFLDHRENRRSLGQWCRGAAVLNLYSYTGAFSLYAARGGARRIVSVDRAAEAMARARDNVALNGFDPEAFEFVTDDAVKYLETLAREHQLFDVVITDPPSFARNRMQRRRALRAYERLHTLALAVLAPGGLYAAASCTSQLDVDTFRDSIAQAAVRSHRGLQVVMDAGQAIDHPVMVGHPEGRYLKFLALRSVDD